MRVTFRLLHLVSSAAARGRSWKESAAGSAMGSALCALWYRDKHGVREIPASSASAEAEGPDEGMSMFVSALNTGASPASNVLRALLGKSPGEQSATVL